MVARHSAVEVPDVPFAGHDQIVRVNLSYLPHDDPWSVTALFRQRDEYGRLHHASWRLSREHLAEAVHGHQMVGEWDVQMWVDSGERYSEPGFSSSANSRGDGERFYLRLLPRDPQSVMYSCPLGTIKRFLADTQESVPIGQEDEVGLISDATIRGWLQLDR